MSSRASVLHDDLARRPRHLVAGASELVERLPVLLDGAVHRRNLHDLADESARSTASISSRVTATGARAVTSPSRSPVVVVTPSRTRAW